MRILLLEDDKMLGAAITQGLHDQGYRVDWVTDGQLALDSLATQEYAGILLDLAVPGVDGLSVLRKLREAGHTMPVFIISAQDDRDTRNESLKQGADDYLTKPFSLYELHLRLLAANG